MTLSILSVRGLRTYYFTQEGVVKAVDDVDLEIGTEEIAGLVGESGCGKSTLGLSIIRLIRDVGRIIEGQIIFKGKDLLSLNVQEIIHIRGNDISMIFQDPMTYLNPIMKVGDQIAEIITTHAGKSKKEADECVGDLLKTIGLGGLENYYPHQLSGGLRQRVLISMALVSRPSLIIADEPTTALDVTVQAQILDLLKELVKKIGSSMLLITHNLGLVADACDRVHVMYAGKIVESADVHELFYNCKHAYTASLLDSAKSIQQLREEIVALPGEPPNLINPPTGCAFHPRCTFAKEICAQKKPNNYEVGPGHSVSCWLYE